MLYGHHDMTGSNHNDLYMHAYAHRHTHTYDDVKASNKCRNYDVIIDCILRFPYLPDIIQL